eukprot:CAMPEP_0178734526 /NCGR_PEP_ID=MMETSP0744-20121128/1390_1 /TAXON_ID=913974 /ORGANISM="Nitzschia punctata, Strain CCMP561" /LENGTH=474 /DNA_ID=CAMNT_0020386811 /DNA_START=32 /DNA_END=1456 /DNA_ORIENTATION=+
MSAALSPLGEIKVADSHFLGFCFAFDASQEVKEWQQRLKTAYPNAAHIPMAWRFHHDEGKKEMEGHTWDEDGEPSGSVGPAMMEEMKNFLRNKDTKKTKQFNKGQGIAVVIVRFFQERLLGVTCGRLGQCYQSIVRLTLHRYFFPGQAMELELDVKTRQGGTDIYGMGAGDCELLLNVVNEDDFIEKDGDGAVPSSSLVEKVLDELKFDGFKGALGEELPRLQNLQADLSAGFIPVYRYPGNYSGDEWITFEWGPTSIKLKKAVEERLLPLYRQTMNHCVTNYYRNGDDFIGHHGDKDLDLNRKGVIVSLSLGDERVLELRRRAQPQDVTRVRLPHCSMLVLGPNTNREWTHSVLPKDGSQDIRLSLTMREVQTFLDLTTGRLFGQGVGNRTLDQVRKRVMVENTGYFAGFCALSGFLVSQKSRISATQSLIVVGAFAMGTIGLRTLTTVIGKKREERAARDFFSKASSSGTKY